MGGEFEGRPGKSYMKNMKNMKNYEKFPRPCGVLLY
jgi:hypothetical protein